MNNIEELTSKARIELIKSMFEIAKSYSSDQLTVPMPDLEALIAQLEAAQKERDDLREKVNQADSEWHKMADRILSAGKRAETAEAALSAANERLLVPGVLRCAKCSFQLAKTNLYMASGTTGPGDNKTEPCPNGCGPLWPVTWEQWSREIGVQLDRYFDEAKELREKLANPVVLNTSDVMSRNYVTKAIKAAGFTVEGE